MNLTPRQSQILTGLASSQTVKELGPLLGISVKTVEFHRAEIMRRLHIFDLPGLTRYAVKQGIIQL
jgi:DNA-binding NarL/FixJ family response regulator